VHKVITYDKRNALNRVFRFIPLIARLRRNNYDLVVSAQLSLTTSLILLFAGIRNRLGFPRQRLMTISVNLPKGLPVVKRYLYLMNALTSANFSHQTELFWDEDTELKVKELAGNYITDNRQVVGIAPGSIWSTKRWLPEYFSELIAKLHNENIQCVLIGGSGDKQLCQKIADESGVNPLNLSCQLTVLGSAALIKRLNLIITNDSAPLHLANAVQTDVIAIFGPTVRKFGFYPFRAHDKVLEVGLKCRPCGKHGGRKCPDKHFSCMKSITPDMVLKEVLDSMEKQ
jgi:heptosyltransferase-2